MNNRLKHRSFTLSIILLLAFAVTFSGCTGASTHSTSTKSNPPSSKPEGEKQQASKKVSLEFWTAPIMDQPDYEKAIQKYTAELAPNVDIKLTYVPFNGIDEKVNVALAANNFPDLYMDGSVRVGPLSARGIAAPVDSYITGDYNIADVMEGPQQLGKVDGKATMFLAAANVSVLMINKALFTKAGAEELLPDATTRTWSREKFSKAVEKVGSLGNGIYGMGLAAPSYSHDRYVDGYIYSDGDGFTDDKYEKFTYNSEKNAKNFDWLVKLSTSKYAVPGVTGNEDKALLEMFKQGKLAIMNYNAGYYDVIKNGIKDGSIKAPIDIMFAYYPTNDASVSKVWLSIYGIIVKKQEDADKMREASKFAAWLTSGKDNDVNEAFYVKKGQIPVRKSLQSLIKEPELQKLGRMAEKPVGNIFNIPDYFQIRKLWANQFQQALMNRISAKDALDNFAKEAQKVLDEAKKAKK
ncbi:MAG: transporter substrate-binding protein [Paenibacillus sp.]|jgi:multiple sugar transport system substrate-binding protein|nr:transporter substrate-binding protein [Paenibacillus sp.]